MNHSNYTDATDKPKLLDQVRTLIRRRHYSLRTEAAYVSWIRRFILFHNKRHPKGMGKVEIEAFLNDLVLKRGVAAATQAQALNAIVFLYTYLHLSKAGGFIKPGAEVIV